MPIIVNMPGGSMDSAGQGMAAAQGYRANEQRMAQIDAEAMRRNDAFEVEKEVALRSMDLKEQQTQFEMEQMAQQQEAEADVLVQQMIEAGMDVGDGGAFREVIGRTSPFFRRQVSADLARSIRMKAEDQRFNAVLGELDLTPETKAKVESGELTSVDAIERSMSSERRKIAEGEEREASRVRTLENWQKHTKDPLFDMPDEGDEAYGDVMELLGEIGPGAGTNSKINYGKLWNQLRLLTTKGMREAARDILQREVGGVDIRGLPKGSFAAVAGRDDLQAREQMGRAAVERFVPRFSGGAPAAQQTEAAQPPSGGTAAAQQTEAAQPPSGGTAAAQPAAPQAPSARLMQPLAETERKMLYGAGPDADTKADVEALKQQLGFSETPPVGTPEYEQLSAALKVLMEKREAEKPKAEPFTGAGRRDR